MRLYGLFRWEHTTAMFKEGKKKENSGVTHREIESSVKFIYSVIKKERRWIKFW